MYLNPNMVETSDPYTKMRVGFVETSSGTHFHLDEPVFLPEDIAHALSMNCRFNGHVSKFYSVAEHSLLVCAVTYSLGGNREQCLEALLHDATEAYLSDVPAPFKQYLPDWRDADAKLDAKLREWANLPSTKTGIVKEADWYALFIEANSLLPDKGECFLDPALLRDKALKWAKNNNIVPLCLSPARAKHHFLSAWADLAEEDPRT